MAAREGPLLSADVVHLHGGSASDDALLARVRAGDDRAFAVLHDRYGRRLERYAARILGPQQRHAEDVVQEAFLRAHRALRRDDRPIALAPWLHTLVRNCALDELHRARPERLVLASDPAAGAAATSAPPDAVLEERDAARAVLADIAALPADQRHALLRRELDGAAHDELSAELGLTARASRALVHRARLNVVKAREARDTSCTLVRADLLAAHDERRRATSPTYRHLLRCRDCRTFRDELRATRRAARLLLPPAVGLAVALAAKLGAGGAASSGGAATTGGGALATKLGGGLAAKAAGGLAALTAGVAGVALVAGPGDPAPVSLQSAAVPGGKVERGAPLPRGTAMVTRVVDLRAGAAPPRVVLPCPDGMRVAGLLPPAGARVGVGYAPGTTIGHSRTARLAFERGGQGAVVVGTLCRRVAPSGSVLPPDARAAAAVPRLWVKVCAPHAYRRTRPGDGAPVAGSVRRAQPLEVRGTRDGWARVRTDAGDRGWIPAAALCRGGVVRPA